MAFVFGLWGRGWMTTSLAELLRESANMGHHFLIICSNLMPGGWLADISDLGSVGNNKGDQMVALVFWD